MSEKESPLIEIPISHDPAVTTLWYRLCRGIARLSCTLLFDFKAVGVHHVPLHGGALLCANHQSFLDPVLFGVNLPRSVTFLARSSLFTNRYFGWLIRSLHAFPLRQGKTDRAAIDETIRRLKEGHLLNIYPEGSRTKTGDIGPIQRGSALVVRRAGVPIIPAIVDGSFQCWPKGKRKFRFLPITVVYGPAIQTEGMSSDEIVEKIDSTLRRMLAELRAGDVSRYGQRTWPIET